MSSKKSCAKCDKGVGTAMCYGCEQAFCTKHFVEHRQELSQLMDTVGLQHDVLCRDIMEHKSHPLLLEINRWEQESIATIQKAAEVARADLQNLLDTTTNDLKESLKKLTEELLSSQESDDYTESNIKKWTAKLDEYRQLLDSPSTVLVDYQNDNQSIIRLIKIKNQEPLPPPPPDSTHHQPIQAVASNNNQTMDKPKICSNEKFSNLFGSITLSEAGLVATCLGYYRGWSSACGTGIYESGVHTTRFRIEHRDMFYVFIGIINASKQLTKDVLDSTSCYGWWDLNYYLKSGKAIRTDDLPAITKNETVTLTLNCTDTVITLKHDKSNRTSTIPIDPQRCPLPWKIVISLYGANDCIRILQ